MATSNKPVTSWSFSRYTKYKQCPAKFKFNVVMGMKEPGNAAMDRGTDIHKLAENYVKGELPRLPAELALFKKEFVRLKKQKVKTVEDDWTWTKDWAHETHSKDWTGAWVRIKIDASYTNMQHEALVPIDFKTGKISDYKQVEYEEQLELYALGGLKKYPFVKIVAPQLWYLDQGVMWIGPNDEQLEYTRADEKFLEKKWAAKIKPMFNDKTYKATPNHGCQWCHFRKSNGGPCKHG